MGDYIYMQGRAKIRPLHREHLKKFFATAEEGPDYELDWPKLEYIDPTIVLYSGWKLLALKYGTGSERVPNGMSNPTGWPDSFDALPIEEGQKYGHGELNLDDDGNLTFKCSGRNHDHVMEAFISLVFYWSDDYEIKLDTREWAFDQFTGDHITTYTRDNEDGFDQIMDVVAETLDKLERKAELWRLAPLTQDEMERLRTIGISDTFINGLNKPSRELADVPQGPHQIDVWSELVHQKLAQMGISPELFSESSPRPADSFVEHIVRLGMQKRQPPRQPAESLNKPIAHTSILDHINAVKRFNRGKLGVRQIKRKQRRKMKG